AAGDELLGLQRGLFCAGAATLLLSLWDVHDESTAQLMRYFYRHYIETADMPGALQQAMRELRQSKPHPFYWAPFVLVGKLTDSKELEGRSSGLHFSVAAGLFFHPFPTLMKRVSPGHSQPLGSGSGRKGFRGER